MIPIVLQRDSLCVVSVCGAFVMYRKQGSVPSFEEILLLRCSIPCGSERKGERLSNGERLLHGCVYACEHMNVYSLYMSVHKLVILMSLIHLN